MSKLLQESGFVLLLETGGALLLEGAAVITDSGGSARRRPPLRVVPDPIDLDDDDILAALAAWFIGRSAA